MCADAKQKGGDSSAASHFRRTFMPAVRVSPLRCLPLTLVERLVPADIHLNLLRLGFGALLELDLQQPVLESAFTLSALTVFGRVKLRMNDP